MFSIEHHVRIASTLLIAAVILLTREGFSQRVEECSLFLAPSTVRGAGRGLIAGADYGQHSHVADDYCIIIESKVVDSTQLHSYSHQYHHSQAFNDVRFKTFIFGPSNFLNTIDVNNVHMEHHEDLNSAVLYSKDNLYPFSILPSQQTITARNINAGEELFLSYGDNWFESRGFQVENLNLQHSLNEHTVNIHDLSRVGICMSDIEVHHSTIPGAGKGVFVAKSFRKGDLVTVSPVLLLPMNVIEESRKSSVLINYVIGVEGALVGLLPLTHAALINHGLNAVNYAKSRHPFKSRANIKVDWFDWSQLMRNVPSNSYAERTMSRNSTIKYLFAQPLENLLSAEFALFDLAYYATEDIHEGQELFIDYGPIWQDFIDFCINLDGLLVNDIRCKHFRHIISIPDSMFPSKWFGGFTSNTNKPRNVQVRTDPCGFFIAPSTLPGAGRGIFAGKKYPANALLEDSTIIFLRRKDADDMAIRDYVFPVGDGSSSVMLTFGMGSVVNSMNKRSVSLPFTIDQRTADNSLQINKQLRSAMEISAGDEIFANYGDQWFAARGHNANDFYFYQSSIVKSRFDDRHVDLEELQHDGVCISDIYVKNSNIRDVGKGVFAAKKFLKGELITISPALLLSMNILEDTKTSSLIMNYVITEEKASVGLLPLTQIAFINHNISANVEIRWFDWNERLRGYQHHTHALSIDMTVQDLLQQPLRQLLERRYPIDLAFYATRDISSGEELYFNYGESWQQSYNTHCQENKRSEFCQSFRHCIKTSGLFPGSWFEE